MSIHRTTVARTLRRPSGAALLVSALVVTLNATGAAALSPVTLREDTQAGGSASATISAADRTDPREAALIDAAKLDTINWRRCTNFSWAPTQPAEADDAEQCADVQFPLDYTKPTGAKISIPVARRKATRPDQRRGTLFVNPGGPGGSAAQTALNAADLFGAEITDRYDVVGVDPRGISRINGIKCFSSVDEQMEQAGAVLYAGTPGSRTEEMRFLEGAYALGKACAGDPNSIARHMTTTQNVRDMELVRQALGEREFNFYGFSYGTFVGQLYANMFPDRVGKIAIDGVLEANAWSGRNGLWGQLLDRRIRSGAAAERALKEALRRCDAVGPARCAQAGQIQRKFQELQARLRQGPIVIHHPAHPDDPDQTGFDETLSLGSLAQYLRSALYSPTGAETVVETIAAVHAVMADNAKPAAERDEAMARAAGQLAAMRVNLHATGNADPATPSSGRESGDRQPTQPEDPSYSNGSEAFLTVVCTDGGHPARLMDAMQQVRENAARVPTFGATWGYPFPACAQDVFLAKDRNIYTGSFDKRTATPLLVIGNQWDPSTNADSAVKTAQRQPGAGLVMSDNWGHTAYEKSACVRATVHAYFETGVVQPKTECSGDTYQPWSGEPAPRFGEERKSLVVPFALPTMSKW